MIYLAIPIALMFLGVFFVYGFYYGAKITSDEHERLRTKTLETQAKCRIQSDDLDAIADYKADSYLIDRMDSTGAKTIITLNHN